MIYNAEGRNDSYAVIGRGKKRAANVELNENQADGRGDQDSNVRSLHE
jgi:hypothetical protein